MSNLGLKKLTANSFLYSFSGILQRASSIFLFPIFSSYLTKKDYGIQSYSSSLASILIILSFLELPRAMTRMMYEKNKTVGHPYKVVGTIFISCFAISICTSTISLALFYYFLQPQLGEIKFYPYIFFTILNIPFQLFYTLYTSFLKATHQGKSAFKLDNSYFLLNVFFNLLFVVGFKTDVIGLIYSTIAANIIIGIVSLRVFVFRIIKYFSRVILRDSLKYSFTVFPFILLGSIGEIADNFFLNKYTGASNLGLFYIAGTFAGIFSLFKESILSAFLPYYFDLSKRGLINQKTSKLITEILIVTAFGALGLAYFNYEVLFIFSRNKELINSYHYIPFIIMGYYFIFIGQLFNIPIYLNSKLIKYLVLTTITSVVIGVSLEIWLIPIYGIIGVVIAKLAAYIAQAIACAILNNKNQANLFPHFKMFSIGFITLLFSMVGYSKFSSYLIWLIAKTSILIVLFVILLIYFNREYKVVNLAKKYLQNFGLLSKK